MVKSKQIALLPDTKLRLVATHKQTFISFEKFITYAEWVNFVKHKDYYYLTYKI